MEEMYWKHFTETGNVSDYLDYKMEVYGHGGGGTERQQRMDRESCANSGCTGGGFHNKQEYN